MNKLQWVAEAILDQEEWLEENLIDWSTVENYADCCGVDISYSDAERIRSACVKWLSLEGARTANAYHYTVTRPLVQ